jgi:hypothetical protein
MGGFTLKKNEIAGLMNTATRPRARPLTALVRFRGTESFWKKRQMALQLMFFLANPLSDAPHNCLDYNSLCPSQKRAADEVLIHSDGRHDHSSSR